MNFPKINITKTLASAGGGIAAEAVTNLTPFIKDQSPLVKNLVPIVVGAYLSSSKKDWVSSAGQGMSTIGAVNIVKGLLKTANVNIPGVSEDVMLNEDVLMNGYGDYSPEGQDYNFNETAEGGY